MSTRPLVTLAMAVAMAFGGALQAQTSSGANSASPGSADQTFMRKAAADGATEVALGQLAMQKAQSGPTKEMARHLVDDHTKANRELAEIAMKRHVEVPSQPESEALAKEKAWGTGPAYDNAYAQMMVKDHRKAIALFTDATKSNDPDVRQFAQTTLPVLKQHLSMAEALAKGSASPSTSSP